MVLKKILLVINSFFGILFFLSFFGVFVSMFFFPRLVIFTHNFNVSLILITIFSFSVFVMSLLKPFLKEMSGFKMAYPTGAGYWLTVSISLVVTLLLGYLSIYSPLKSKYLGELTFDSYESQKTIAVNATGGKKIYFEFDAGPYSTKGTMVKTTINGPNNWLFEKTFTVGKKDDTPSERKKIIIGTTTTSPTPPLPANGEYTIKFEQLDNNVKIKKVRVFEK